MLQILFKISSLFGCLLFVLSASAERILNLTVSGPALIEIESFDGRALRKIQLKEGQALHVTSLPSWESSERNHEILTRSRIKYPDSEECALSSSCREICRDIYASISTQAYSFCVNFPKSQAEKLVDIDKGLDSFGRLYNKFTDGDLLFDFEVFVLIHPKVLTHYITRFSNSEKRKFSALMAQSGKFLHIFGAVAGYTEFDRLSKRLLYYQGSDMHTGFIRTLADGKNFIDLTKKEERNEAGVSVTVNVDALNFMNDFFEDRCRLRDDYEDTDLCVFREGYCKIGLTEYWSVLSAAESAVSAVNYILDNYTTAEMPVQLVEFDILNLPPQLLEGSQINTLCSAEFIEKT